MSDMKNTSLSTSLLLRLLGGGYLIYLAWDMRGAVSKNPLYLIPIIIFAVAGIALAVHTLRTLVKDGYFLKTPQPETDSTEKTMDNSDT